MLNLITNTRRFILLIGDIAVLYLSLWITLLVRYQKPVTAELWDKHWLPFSGVFFIWLIIFFINKLYELSVAKNNLKFYALLLTSLAWCTAVGFVFFYLTTTGISPKTILILNIIIFGILFSLWRQLFNKVILSKKLRENVIIIGLAQESIELIKEINKNPQMGIKVAGVLLLEEREINDFPNIDRIKEKNLKNYLETKKIRTIIIGSKVKRKEEIINQLYRSLDLKVNIFDLPSFAEKFTDKILINTIGQVWFLENIKEQNKRYYTGLKRIIDIILSLILLIISLPFLPFVILSIKSNSPGPIFFKQTRTGKNSKQFMAIKFRSMHVNSEKNGPQWAEKNDPRVTKIGKFLRKTRIDEIPQLINVLRGEMGFIGPRPERPEFIAQLKEKIPFYETRLLVKPGITGWAQIMGPAYGGSEKESLEKLQYDLYYIKNRSSILDLSIILKTVKIVLSGGGQ